MEAGGGGEAEGWRRDVGDGGRQAVGKGIGDSGVAMRDLLGTLVDMLHIWLVSTDGVKLDSLLTSELLLGEGAMAGVVRGGEGRGGGVRVGMQANWTACLLV